MNKIVLEKVNVIDLNIKEDSICNIDVDYDIKDLNIVIDNSKLIINHYDEINNKKMNINVVQNNNSSFIYNYSFICKNDYDLNIFINLTGNNNKNIIKINGVSNGGKSNIIIDGKVDDNTLDNDLDEKVKMININNGESIIKPNMYINTKNVLANHSVSISDVSNDYLFYLNSKGIDKEKATKLIINGFLNIKKDDFNE